MGAQPAKTLIVNCPKCGTPNDLTAQAKAKAAAATMKEAISVEGKCTKCGAAIRHGPFDPFFLKVQ